MEGGSEKRYEMRIWKKEAMVEDQRRSARKTEE